MNTEWRITWKETVVMQFKILSRHFPGGTDKKHQEHQTRYPVSGPRFESAISVIGSKSDNLLVGSPTRHVDVGFMVSTYTHTLFGSISSSVSA